MPPRRKPRSLTWRFERSLRPVEATLIVGLDEVGRGCWAGPVYAAAAALPDGLRHPRLNDSKQIASEHREELSAYLCAHPEIHWSIGIATVEEIDSHNILQASLLAMRRAVAGLAIQPHLCLVDGNRKAGLPYPEITVVDGDALCPSIAAASIIAKVARDRALAELAGLYPAYGLENHKGYGTPEHARALALHGPCPIHRQSFRPVREHTRSPSHDSAGNRLLW